MKTLVAVLFVLALLISGCGTSDVTSTDDESNLGFERVVLGELFVAVTCTKCPIAEAALNQLYEEETAAKIATIHWHPWINVGDRDAIDFGRLRLKGFVDRDGGQSGLPTCYVNGVRKILGALSYEEAYDSYSDAYTREREVNSDLKIDLSPQLNESQVTSSISIVSVSTADLTNADLISVLLENEAENTNAPLGPESWSYLPRVAETQVVSLESNSSATFSVTLPIEASWNRDNLFLAVFVQEANCGEVLQSVLVPLSDSKN